MASVENIPDPRTDEVRPAPAIAPIVARNRPARFDRIARLYRAMEYVSFGPVLERCRFHHVPALADTRRALVLGDGDGRFLARLLASVPHLQADAVDASSAMLHLLHDRIAEQGDLHRLTTTCADARHLQPPSGGYDLIVTHFFLDCLTLEETEQLITRLRPHLVPGASWLVAEFEVPRSGVVRRGLARGIISLLYAAFRLLTGLTVRRIPPWRTLLAQHGFAPRASRSWLGGLVISELWELPSARQPRAILRASTYK